jgi:hypothetical protein
MQPTAIRDLERRVVMASLPGQTLIALECGGLTPPFERKHRAAGN